VHKTLISQEWPANLGNVRDICKYISECAENFGLSSRDIHKVELAIEEVVVNIVKYSKSEESNSIIKVTVIGDSEKLQIKIEDNGVPFNPLDYGEPALNTSILERQIGGLGIFLVKKMVDNVEYERIGNKNVLTLVKFVKHTEGDEHEDNSTK